MIPRNPFGIHQRERAGRYRDGEPSVIDVPRSISEVDGNSDGLGKSSRNQANKKDITIKASPVNFAQVGLPWTEMQRLSESGRMRKQKKVRGK